MNTENVQIPAWLDRDEIVRRVIEAGIEIEAARLRREMRFRAKRINADPVSVWLQERTRTTCAWTLQKDLYADYTKWCEDNGFTRDGSALSFSKCLHHRGYAKRTTKNGVMRRGISLR